MASEMSRNNRIPVTKQNLIFLRKSLYPYSFGLQKEKSNMLFFNIFRAQMSIFACHDFPPAGQTDNDRDFSSKRQNFA